MDTVAIISEYNPFHKGHKYQIEQIKTTLPDSNIVSIMSPNFVQRGEPAAFDKYVRGESAVRCGVDLAISMPQVFSLLSAEGFAEGGVKIAKKSGATYLAFGVENYDNDLLYSIAGTLISEDFETALKSVISDSPTLSYPVLRERALEKILGEKAVEFIRTPNNILGVEYVKAILKFAPEIKILPIKRIGNGYSDTSKDGDILSATAIREIMYGGGEFLEKIPVQTANTVINANKFEFLKYEEFLFSNLFTKNEEELFFSCGNKELTNIIRKNAQKHPDYKSFRSSISRKKHPETKINRALTSILLGIGFDEFCHDEPEYAVALAMNNRGKEIISSLKKVEGFTVISRGADLKKLAFRSADVELFADRIYARCMNGVKDCNYFLKKKPYIQED